MMLRIGDTAPDFEAPDQERRLHRLSDERGKWVVLYFYPKDETAGCTAEACSFRDAAEDYRGRATVWGVSADTVESHRAFAEHHRLPFPLLSDPDRHIHGLYGAGSLLHKRVTFLINPEGEIAQIYDNVVPKGHAQEILQDVAVEG
ncbi:MAG: peroxiredoxin [Candidatus Peribacteraceae bacterium]|jgi:peroxiredoxin Q/BCP